MSADQTLSRALRTPETVVNFNVKQEEWYHGPVPVALLSNTPHRDPLHKDNRGYRVYDADGPAATITTTSTLAPGGATQLYFNRATAQRTRGVGSYG